ncbi:hypothetical protein EKH55_2522 [Sinorhizobium alkalisoli]|nr:hypothetical protein EKH55_2522 [Sinorhizobium alkalisoli]
MGLMGKLVDCSSTSAMRLPQRCHAVSNRSFDAALQRKLL